MKKSYMSLLALLMAGMSLPSGAQLIPQTLDNPKNTPAAVFPVPNKRQLAWHETEFYGFFHYGMNTFTGREWGEGNESETIYAPTQIPNCEQWISSIKAGGMKGAVIVAKHHDGFCLWPTESTTHSILKSGGVGPQVDIPKLTSEACKKLDMKFGVYISPWDRNNTSYATSDYVQKVFMTQISELCTKYGPLFEVWFDGANGGNGYYGGNTLITKTVDKSTYYDWPNIADSIHAMQPDALVWGLEYRWIGNEAGYAGIVNWANEDTYNVANNGYLNNGYENGWEWIGGETDAKGSSAGWFWHEGQSSSTAEQMYKIYMESVGRNSTLILNIPPNTDGVIPEASVDSLARLGRLITNRLGNDLVQNAKSIEASSTRDGGTEGNYSIDNVKDNDNETYWATDDSEVDGNTVTISWDETQKVHYVMLQEYIPLGQRVRSFTIETSSNGTSWVKRNVDLTKTIGYKRIIPITSTKTDSYGTAISCKYIRITFDDCRACPLIKKIAVY